IYSKLCELVHLCRPAPPELNDIPPEIFRRLLSIARIHGILGIVLGKVEHLAGLDSEIWEISRRCLHSEIAKRYQGGRRHHQLKQRFREAQIPIFAFKGSDFADHLYPDPHLRPTFDVDIMVPRNRWDDSAAILEAHGHFEKPDQEPMYLPIGVMGKEVGFLTG